MIDVKTIGKWGANPAIRLNGTELAKTGICEGDKVTLKYQKGKIIIEAVKK